MFIFLILSFPLNFESFPTYSPSMHAYQYPTLILPYMIFDVTAHEHEYAHLDLFINIRISRLFPFLSMLYLLISVFMLSLAKQTQDTPSALDNIAAYVQN